MAKKHKFNKTEESIYTLLSLYVLINQNLEVLFGKEDIMHSNFDPENYSFSDLINDTVHEALIYQILLKTCSYLDEWNKIFGVHTEPKDRDKILVLKKIAKPAHKCISSWKHLRDFRNHYIAHNHRNENGENVFLNHKEYDAPQSLREIYLLAQCLDKMSNLIRFFFIEDLTKIVKMMPRKSTTKSRKVITKEEMTNKIKEIETIDAFISNSLMRNNIINSVVKNSKY